jgi:transcriptional regulator with GAF, ATPase, and Fis domain
MSSSLGWATEERSSNEANLSPAPLLDAALNNRLNTLREVALTLLREVESLRVSQQSNTKQSVKLYDEVQRFETELIRSALVRTGGNQTRAAQLLGVKLTTLNTKVKRYNISSVGRTASIDDVSNDLADEIQDQENAA